MNKKKIRTRIAPSPTGPMHVGTARAALFNHIFARQHKGDFILRIEDTDEQRSDPRFEKDILNSLEWLKIDYDEFYKQSERTEIYKKYLTKLLEQEKAFFCRHSKEELAEEKKKQMKNKEAPRHVCEHKQEADTTGIIRLKGSDKKIKFKDLIRGEIEYNGALLGDMAIAKDEETPLYNFAVVVDDYEMEISHVIRGEDHIPNTPKQILIQEALDIETPVYAHIPLTLAPDRSKMSKRHGATSISEYKKTGYLPEAFVNFLALLGWNPGNNKEIISREELLKIFDIDRFQKGGAIFNIDKLDWFNREYIKKMSIQELSKRVLAFVPDSWRKKAEKKPEYWTKILKLEKERLTKLSDIRDYTEFFFKKPVYPKDLLVWKDETPANTKQHLDKILNLLSSLETEDFTQESVKKSVWNYAEKQGRGNVLWPFRVSLTGLAKSPEPFGVSEILGKEETIKRLKYALEII